MVIMDNSIELSEEEYRLLEDMLKFMDDRTFMASLLYMLNSKAFVEDEKFRETYKYECMRRFSLSLDATVDKSLAEFSDCDDYYEYFIENFDAEGFVKSHPEFS